MKMKEESEKAGFKLHIQKTKIMVSGPLTSWQIERGKVEAVTDFLFLGSKITAMATAAVKLEDACFFEEKLMTNLDNILKSKDSTLPTKICLVKAMVFPVVMYGYESWTIKKAGYRRIDAFELWSWRGS